MTIPTPDSKSFDTLALSAASRENLRRLGYIEMTAIQAASLPTALQGRDLIAQAKTGSGKTASFALPLLARLDVRRFAVQALVLCPTRELAEQVTTEIRRHARAEDNGKDDKMKEMAQKMVDAQTQEIDQLKTWIEDHAKAP